MSELTIGLAQGEYIAGISEGWIQLLREGATVFINDDRISARAPDRRIRHAWNSVVPSSDGSTRDCIYLDAVGRYTIGQLKITGKWGYNRLLYPGDIISAVRHYDFVSALLIFLGIGPYPCLKLNVMSRYLPSEVVSSSRRPNCLYRTPWPIPGCSEQITLCRWHAASLSLSIDGWTVQCTAVCCLCFLNSQSR